MPATTAAAETLSIHRQRRRIQCFRETTLNLNLDLMLVPGGSFLMGSPPDELERHDSEEPQHEVTVPPFLMGRYPITQAQWRIIASQPPEPELEVQQSSMSGNPEEPDRTLDPDPSYFKGDDRPVEQVSWYDAMEFCRRLSNLTGHPYRLPTEAEWEYACRAGTTTPFHFGETITTDLANYRGTDDEGLGWSGSYGKGPKGIYRETTTPVNHFDPLANAFGLCDMHGNVLEWCLDHWHENYEGAPTDGSPWLSEDEASDRVIRGGSWVVNPWVCRSAFRVFFAPGDRNRNFGFRVVCGARGL